jgi:hypothetical protein
MPLRPPRTRIKVRGPQEASRCSASSWPWDRVAAMEATLGREALEACEEMAQDTVPNMLCGDPRPSRGILACDGRVFGHTLPTRRLYDHVLPANIVRWRCREGVWSRYVGKLVIATSVRPRRADHPLRDAPSACHNAWGVACREHAPHARADPIGDIAEGEEGHRVCWWAAVSAAKTALREGRSDRRQ